VRLKRGSEPRGPRLRARLTEVGVAGLVTLLVSIGLPSIASAEVQFDPPKSKVCAKKGYVEVGFRYRWSGQDWRDFKSTYRRPCDDHWKVVHDVTSDRTWRKDYVDVNRKWGLGRWVIEVSTAVGGFQVWKFRVIKC
jgi:hypothetical protein